MNYSTELKSPTTVKHHSIDIDGISIFYREAGDPNAETIVMLHGFPSSSHMYRNLIKNLSDQYHIIAPDFPGFGFSGIPPTEDFEYTFDNIALVTQQFLKKLELESFYLMMQDYGGPIGMRIASANPQFIKGLIIQNANSYKEGFGEWAMKIGGYKQANDMEGINNFKNYLISEDGIKEQYFSNGPNSEKVDPISYLTDAAFMKRKGVNEIQTALFINYGSNFPKYAEWQQYLREHQPKTLVLWGEHDKFFSKAGGEAYRKDLKEVEIHFFDGGHFMLEEYPQEAVELISEFLDK